MSVACNSNDKGDVMVHTLPPLTFPMRTQIHTQQDTHKKSDHAYTV